MKTLRLDAVVLDDDARAADDLARVTLTVDLAQTGPGAKNLRISDLDQVDLVLGAKSLNELDVLGLRARLDEHAQVRLALVQGLRALTETTGETVVNEGVLQDLLRVERGFEDDGEPLINFYIPEAHPQRKACPWELRWGPQPQRGRRLGSHQKRQTSCTRKKTVD